MVTIAEPLRHPLLHSSLSKGPIVIWSMMLARVMDSLPRGGGIGDYHRSGQSRSTHLHSTLHSLWYWKSRSRSLAPHLVSADGFKTGLCTTRNSLDASDEDSVQMLSNDASCKDMEAAALALACALHPTGESRW